jgi:hypothetical protein
LRMELKSRSFTSKEPHVAREPQVADPWSRVDSDSNINKYRESSWE